MQRSGREARAASAWRLLLNQASWSARVTTDPTMISAGLTPTASAGSFIEGAANDPLAGLGATLDQRHRGMLIALPWASSCSRMVAQEEEAP